MEGGGWRIEDGEWRIENGGWRIGGWRGVWPFFLPLSLFHPF
jgi:hypothetical protein